MRRLTFATLLATISTAAELGDGTQLKQAPDSWLAIPHVVPVPVRP